MEEGHRSAQVTGRERIIAINEDALRGFSESLDRVMRKVVIYQDLVITT